MVLCPRDTGGAPYSRRSEPPPTPVHYTPPSNRQLPCRAVLSRLHPNLSKVTQVQKQRRPAVVEDQAQIIHLGLSRYENRVDQDGVHETIELPSCPRLPVCSAPQCGQSSKIYSWWPGTPLPRSSTPGLRPKCDRRNILRPGIDCPLVLTTAL